MECSWAVGCILIRLLRGGGSVALTLGTPCSLKVWRSVCGSHQPSTNTEDKRLDFFPIHAFQPSNQLRIHFVTDYAGNNGNFWQPPPPQASSQEAPFLEDGFSRCHCWGDLWWPFLLPMNDWNDLTRVFKEAFKKQLQILSKPMEKVGHLSKQIGLIQKETSRNYRNEK